MHDDAMTRPARAASSPLALACALALVGWAAPPGAHASAQPATSAPVTGVVERAPRGVRRELNRAEALLRKGVAGLPADSGVQIVRSGRQVVLRVPARCLFAADSEQLQPDGQVRPLLQLPEQLLRRRRHLTLRVAVYTDNIGGGAFNAHLAGQRAQSVVAALESAGIAASRVQAEGDGLTAALASNDTPEGRLQNRRVEFVFEVRREPAAASAGA